MWEKQPALLQVNSEICGHADLGEMGQQVKELPFKADDLYSVPRTHIKIGENRLARAVFPPPQECRGVVACVYVCVHTSANRCDKKKLKIKHEVDQGKVWLYRMCTPKREVCVLIF